MLLVTVAVVVLTIGEFWLGLAERNVSASLSPGKPTVMALRLPIRLEGLQALALIVPKPGAVLRHSSSSPVDLASQADQSVNTDLTSKPSTDIDNPTPLIVNTVRGNIAPAVSNYYSFYGGPGEIKVTADAKIGGTAGEPKITIQFIDKDANILWETIVRSSDGIEQRKIARSQLDKQQEVIMRVLNNSSRYRENEAEYRVRLEGAVRLKSMPAPNEQQ